MVHTGDDAALLPLADPRAIGLPFSRRTLGDHIARQPTLHLAWRGAQFPLVKLGRSKQSRLFIARATLRDLIQWLSANTDA